MPTNVMPQVMPTGMNAGNTASHAASVLSPQRVDALRLSLAARLRAGAAPATIVREDTALLTALQN